MFYGAGETDAARFEAFPRFAGPKLITPCLMGIGAVPSRRGMLHIAEIPVQH